MKRNYFGNSFSSNLKIGGFVIASLGASHSAIAEEKKDKPRETTQSIKKSSLGIAEDSADENNVQERHQLKNR